MKKTNSYKILLQLSQSADIAPSSIDFSAARTYPSDLIFTSSHELKHNHWHHITFNWGAENYNNYTGSLHVDENKTEIVIPSASIGTSPIGTTDSAIFVGNYYDGPVGEISKFFNAAASAREGIASIHPGKSQS